MPRKPSNTLDYISLDVTDKTTLRRLYRRFGVEGRLFWYELLRLIARTENYVLDFSDPDIAEDYFIDELFVEKEVGISILNQLAQWGNIDEILWKKEKKVWCQNLIERHISVFKKRNKIPVNPRCTNISVTETVVSAAETPISGAEITQSKVKESKVKKTTIDNNLFRLACEKDPQWMETQIMQTKSNIETIKKYLQKFCNRLIQISDQKENQRDFNTHFTNWLNTHKIEKVTPKQKKTRYA